MARLDESEPASPFAQPGATATAVGAYGLTVTGPVAALAADLLVAAPAHWPSVELVWAPPLVEPVPPSVFGTHEALLALVSGGHVFADRRRRVARFHKVGAADGHEVAHPCLRHVGVTFGRWDGRVAFHGGGVLVNGAVWGVLGDKESGKSTTLAWLASAGHGIFADDLLVLEGSMVVAGPRAIDLRPGAAARHHARNGLLEVRQGERHRLLLPDVPFEAPLGGFVVLSAGNEVSLELVHLGERVEILRQHLTLRRAGLAGPALLELLTVPMWRAQRSRDWSDLPRLLDRLVTTFARAA